MKSQNTSVKPKNSRNQRQIHNKSAQRTTANKSINRYKLGCQFSGNSEMSEGSSMIVEKKVSQKSNDILTELKEHNRSKYTSLVDSNISI